MEVKSARDFLCKTWNPGIYLKSRYLYALGNTVSEDLLEQFDLGENLDILLLGAGDVRHILTTVGNCHRDLNQIHKKRNKVKHIAFILNDIDPVLIARNAVILEIITSITPEKKDDMAFLWEVWYNMEISKEHHQKLLSIIERLIQGKGLGKLWKFMDKNTDQTVKDIWKNWINSSWGVAETRNERQKVMQYAKMRMAAANNTSVGDTGDYADSASPTLAMNLTLQADIQKASSSDKGCYEDVLASVKAFFRKGSTHPKGYEVKNDGTEINPTLMRPGSPMWHVHYGNEPFTSHGLMTSHEYETYKSLTDVQFSRMGKMVSYFRKMMTQIDVDIQLCCEDGLYCCSSGFRKDMTFDLIHTTNVGDHVGLVNLLLCTAPRLKNSSSVLMTQSMTWQFEFASIPEYLKKTLGCDPMLYPTLFGLKLADDLDLGKTEKNSTVGGGAENFIWMKADTEHVTPITFKESRDLTQALEHFVDLYFRTSGPLLQHSGSGRTSVTALTLASLVERLKDIMQGGVASLVEVVERKCTERSSLVFYWETVKAAFGFDDKENEFVVINYPSNLNIPEGPEAVGTAALAVLTLNTVDLLTLGLTFKDLSSFPRGLHLIFNYIYNGNDDTFSVLLKKSTYKGFGDWTVSMAMPINPLLHGFASQLLGSKVTAEYKTTAEKRDLITSNNDSLSKGDYTEVQSLVEENYRFVITISVDNKASKITVTSTKFLPSDHCSNIMEIEIGCEHFKRCKVTLKFSCYVDQSKCHIQISSKKGIIIVNIAKHHLRNSGRSILPFSQVSIQKLERLDTTDKQRIAPCLGEMFMGPDMWLKSRNATSSDPFYNFRDTLHFMWMAPIQQTKKEMFVLKRPEDEHTTKCDGNCINIAVLGHYWYKGIPFMHVKYRDWKLFDAEVKKNPDSFEKLSDAAATAMYDITGYTVRREGNLITRLPKDEKFQIISGDVKEHDLFRKVLYTNSLRLVGSKKKHQSVTDFIESFLQLHYPRIKPFSSDLGKFMSQCEEAKASATAGAATASTPVTDQIHSCGSCQRSHAGMKKCSRCKVVWYCDVNCQRQHWQTHKAQCKK